MLQCLSLSIHTYKMEIIVPTSQDYCKNITQCNIIISQSCPDLCDPMAPLSMGFSRQEY